MAKKSQLRKSQLKHPPKSPAGIAVPVALAFGKPWQIAAVCVILAVVTLFTFRGVRHNDFLTYDDGVYVAANSHVQQGVNLRSIAWAFTTFDQSNWHPLTWISHMVDWDLYGNNPAGHHITNACLHAANAILLFLFLIYVTGYLGRSAMVAFLFALHPAHVESVAWLAERKDVLCAFFSLLTLLAYAWYLRRPSWKRYAWIVCGFSCALMSKPMAVTLPFILLLLDYWPLHRIAPAAATRAQWFSSLWKLCVEKWPFFIMSFLSSVVTYLAQQAGGSVILLQAFPMWVRICNAAISYGRYLRIAFWPNPLTAYYYHERIHIELTAAVVSAIALILISVLCWKLRKTRPYCLFGWLWFLGTLVPVIGIVQVGYQAMAERYTYLPFIGIFIAFVWLVGDAVANSPKMKVAAQLLAVAVIAACALKTDAQVKVWKDTVTLFTHAVEVDPRGELPNSTLGVAYLRQGKLALAQDYFEHALIYNPYGTMTLSYSAYTLMQTHDRRYLPLAEQRLKQALIANPNDSFSLAGLALWSALMGMPKDEEAYSRRALAIEPDFVAARIYLANALQSQGKLDEAAQECRRAIAIEPNNVDAHNGLAAILGKQGLPREALKEFQLSLAIQPDQAIIHYNAGSILMSLHQFPEAIAELNQALRLDPANAHMHNDLGVALSQLQVYDKAAEQFSDAVRIDPTYADAKRNLNLALVRMKTIKPEQARK
jgi:tetratricopeptide (TPR) repeat protein